jgi:hypothetical protein
MTAAGERGTALVIVILSVMLLTALGSALVLISVTETGISAHYRTGFRALYAADAALVRAVADLAASSDWNAALAGGARSTFTDGGPGGVRGVAGMRVDLDALTRSLRCGTALACDGSGVGSLSGPWGLNNPAWQLYAWGPLSQLLPSPGDRDIYLTVWVGDDPEEADSNPLLDEERPDQPGHGVIRLVASAHGPGGARRTLEATLARDPPPPDDAGTATGSSAVPAGAPRARVIAWREVR